MRTACAQTRRRAPALLGHGRRRGGSAAAPSPARRRSRGLRLEPHVEHVVGLVGDEEAHVLQLEHPIAHEVGEAPRRADDDVELAAGDQTRALDVALLPAVHAQRAQPNAAASPAASRSICCASSRVGASTMPRGAPISRFAAFSPSTPRRSSTAWEGGSRASCPTVCAMPTTSRPCSASGSACAWIAPAPQDFWKKVRIAPGSGAARLVVDPRDVAEVLQRRRVDVVDVAHQLDLVLRRNATSMPWRGRPRRRRPRGRRSSAAAASRGAARGAPARPRRPREEETASLQEHRCVAVSPCRSSRT